MNTSSPPDISNYTVEGVLQFLTQTLIDYNVERTKWVQEKEELLRKISQLEKEKAFFEQQLVEQDHPPSKRFEDSSSSFQRSLESRISEGAYRSLSATRRFFIRHKSKADSETNLPSSLAGDDEAIINQAHATRRPTSSPALSENLLNYYSSNKRVSVDVLRNSLKRMSSHLSQNPEGTPTAPTPEEEITRPENTFNTEEEEDSLFRMEDVDMNMIKEAQKQHQQSKERILAALNASMLPIEDAMISPAPVESLLEPSSLQDISPPPLREEPAQEVEKTPMVLVNDKPQPRSHETGVYPPSSEGNELISGTEKPLSSVNEMMSHQDSLSDDADVSHQTEYPLDANTHQPTKYPLDANTHQPTEYPLDTNTHQPTTFPLDTNIPQPIETTPQPTTFPLDADIPHENDFHHYISSQTNYFHLAPIQSLHYEPETNTLLSCDKRGTVCLWDTSDGNLNLHSYPSQVIYTSSHILSSTWLAVGECFALGDLTGDIVIYRAETSCPGYVFTEDGVKSSELASKDYNGLFDTGTKEYLTVLSNHSDAVWCLFNNFYDHQQLLFSSSASGSLICHNLEEESYMGYAVDAPVSSITSNRGWCDYIFTGDVCGKVSMLDIAESKVVSTFDPVTANPHHYSHTGISEDPIYCVDMHPEYPLIAAGTKYGQVHLFDIRDPHRVVSYKAHTDSISQIAFHPWKPVILTGGYDNCIKFWSIQNRSMYYQLNDLFKPQFDESSVHFDTSSISGSIAIGGVDGVIKCYT